MKKLLLAVALLGSSAVAAYAANCCWSQACCPGPCCDTAK